MMIFVYLAFLIICLFIIYKYKRYSCLWYFSIYGVIIAILNITYYFRFKNISIKEEKEEEYKNQKIKAKKEEFKKENKNKNPEKKEINNKLRPKIISSNPKTNIGSSLGKLINTKNTIKEVLSEEEITHKEKITKINEFNSINNINNINSINDKMNMTYMDKNIQSSDKKMIPMGIENDEDIIYNPYREDFMPDSEISKKSKGNQNKNNMNIPELNFKYINNKSNSEENNILKSYRSFGSEDNRLGSIDSKNPINRIGGFNSKLFSNSAEKSEEKREESEDDGDNSSVIHNPLRDDINN